MELKVTAVPLEYSSELFRGENSFGAESDLIVPDNMPDILTVLQISANAATSACDPQNDRVLLTGNVFFNILYVADTPKREVRAINTGAMFSNIFSAPGVRDGMPVLSEVNVSSISYDLANCRKISVHSQLLGRITVYGSGSIELPTAAEGAELRSTALTCSVIKARGSAQETVTDSFELPVTAGARVLRDEVRITDRAIKIISNKAIIKGTVGVGALYESDGVIRKFSGEIPFTKVVNAEGLTDAMEVDYTIDVQGWETELGEGEEGRRSLDVETMLYFNVLGRVTQSCSAISDAYFPGRKLVCETQRLSLWSPAPAESEECPIKASVRLPASSGEADLIYDICGSPVITRVVREDGDIVIEGAAEVSVLYRTLDPENPTAAHSFEAAFRHQVSGASWEELPRVSAELRNMNCSLTGGGLEVRGMALLTLERASAPEAEVVTSMRLEDEPPAESPSILISYMAGGRSLWDIAKSYNVSRDKLMAANDITSEEELRQKKALIIPR